MMILCVVLEEGLSNALYIGVFYYGSIPFVFQGMPYRMNPRRNRMGDW